MQNSGHTPVRRVFVEKRAGFDIEARLLQSDIVSFLGARCPSLAALRRFRVLQRYDVAKLSQEQFRAAVDLVFSEPQCDAVFYDDPAPPGSAVFGIEYIPGQYNQRSDSAEQCVELAAGIRPVVHTARIFILESDEPVPGDALKALKQYLINPVDSREAALDLPASLEFTAPEPGDVPEVSGFTAMDGPELAALAGRYGLAMSVEDLLFCRDHFRSCGRDPSLAELRVLDTYWSDHCRHTTFATALETITLDLSGDAASGLKRALALYEEARREVYGEGAEQRKRTLMDIATIGARILKKRGLLEDLDESAEINACSIRIRAEFRNAPGEEPVAEPWLLLFKNETHNHPTEIEPFGGAATCLGGAIRDPLSGRAFVHQAMRISGGADPRSSLANTLPGKLPQLKIAREAAAGYSSYGNQIGLATGQVSEFYHPGFLAKRFELGAVIAAVPRAWVRREEPAAGDLALLLGGKTGRDGIGGATGSSRAHTGESVETAGAEVQKGNAVEERKLQRLFRNSEVTALIKRCNDFGAGGVAVAVGELAPGLDIALDSVPKKYAGLDGIELAISESQERMAVVAAPSDADALIRFAAVENLDAAVIAVVTAGGAGDETPPAPADADGGPRLRMSWRGKTIVDLSRRFLGSNGAPRSAAAVIGAAAGTARDTEPEDMPCDLDRLERELGSLRSGSRRGLQERFDGSVGAASALFPWGGAEQGTPECGMAALLATAEGDAFPRESLTASLMSFGYDPDLSERSPYEGAKGAIREALAKYACLGGDPRTARISLQEYFERMDSPEAWGKPLAALLGALEAQLALGVPAIGGKDSMSGSYRDQAKGIDLSVPPALVAFAAGTAPARTVRSGALSGKPGNVVILLYQDPGKDEWDVFKANMNALSALTARGLVSAAYPVGSGGVAAALALMAFGNMAGLDLNAGALTAPGLHQGAVLAELNDPEEGTALLRNSAAPAPSWVLAARTLSEPVFRLGGEEKTLAALRRAYELPLAQVYPQTSSGATVAEPAVPGPGSVPGSDAALAEAIAAGAARSKQPGKHRSSAAVSRSPEAARPLAVLPVFPGTNCEWDMERAFRRAGARTRLVIFRNRNSGDILESRRELAAAIGEAQILALSGGFSAGDEPDGSGKFIANVFRSPAIAEEVTKLLELRSGLILGICNGFQALIKLGLVPYGRYCRADPSMPALSFNRIGRHVSRMVRTKVISAASPWLSLEELGAVHVLPVSHGEGRVVIREEEGRALFASGQVPFCYADARGRPAMAEPHNPNGSDFAIEALASPDGRVLGKMAHSERCGEYVHTNIPGNKTQRIFEAGVKYFQ
ncbi:MAG: phosphoribosylformylglycinamidine synthase [Treponema sp.]|jgi:phosphoribosylformylglycinamidine synthase|nr:phosphoribosylformylglycinamidine synthase [Treponema sp.]